MSEGRFKGAVREGCFFFSIFRDVYYVSTAKDKSWQQIHRIEERKKETTFTRNVVTQEEYDKTLAKARMRMRGVF